MATSREQVMEALLARTKSLLYPGTFKLVTRRWVSWLDDQVVNPQTLPPTPFLIQWESPDAEEYIRPPGSGLPPNRTWSLYILMYGKIPPLSASAPGVPDKTTPGASVLNPLIDAYESLVMAPDDPQSGRLTLGGLVVDCGIDGTIVKALGDNDPSGLCGAVVPVRIKVQ